MTKVDDLRTLLSRMDGSPTLHVNGDGHSTAFLTVDFGQPNTPPEVSTEDFEYLAAAMRAAASEMNRRRGNPRVQSDVARGIYWIGFPSN